MPVKQCKSSPSLRFIVDSLARIHKQPKARLNLGAESPLPPLADRRHRMPNNDNNERFKSICGEWQEGAG